VSCKQRRHPYLALHEPLHVAMHHLYKGYRHVIHPLDDVVGIADAQSNCGVRFPQIQIRHAHVIAHDNDVAITRMDDEQSFANDLLYLLLGHYGGNATLVEPHLLDGPELSP
jgi:hypothetical protein